jgi:hypothetical protein
VIAYQLAQTGTQAGNPAASSTMKRPKHLLARAEDGTQVVILEIESDAAPGEQPKVRYELANRSEVKRFSDTEFVVVQTGAVLLIHKKG